MSSVLDFWVFIVWSRISINQRRKRISSNHSTSYLDMLMCQTAAGKYFHKTYLPLKIREKNLLMRLLKNNIKDIFTNGDILKRKFRKFLILQCYQKNFEKDEEAFYCFLYFFRLRYFKVLDFNETQANFIKGASSRHIRMNSQR